ncbi:MAG: glycosyltransferase family 39 protein [Verrucomicrobiota bacterium]
MLLVQPIDESLFRFINQTLSNPLFDAVMPFASDTPFFRPLVLVVLAALVWKGGVRGRVCALMLVLAVFVGDGLICGPLKRAIGRPRPFLELSDAIVRVGRGGSGSMPSSHAANWFAATAVTLIYYRRSVFFMLPLALLVSFSRIYCGVHYPTDVTAGALLGAVYGAAGVWSVNALWQSLGRRWFPLWWKKLPSLVPPFSPARARESKKANAATTDQHWLRLGYLLIAVLLFARLAYIASDKIELSEDEAYQWLWSKHLALSYFSKPPLIAYTQFLGTHLWGDTAFGVRFFSPVIAAVLSLLLLRFFAREIRARIGFWLVPISAATPLLAVGATLMTIDPLSVLFWTAALVSGWRAVRNDSTAHWLWTGLWMGFGFLSKYTALFQLLCWAVFFWLWPPARPQLRRPGPYLALVIMALCAVPVVIWNQQHDWITLTHVAGNAGLDKEWRPTLRYAWEFFGSELGLLNPIFFTAAVLAAAGCWNRSWKSRLSIYLFSMGAPVFLIYAAYTVRSRVQPNWIAPSVLPLFCLMAVYWEARWRNDRWHVSKGVRVWLAAGLGLGLSMVILLHDTNLIAKIIGRALPIESDPLRRVRGWKETAEAAGEARAKLLTEGKPVFIIGDHYGISGLISFYLPEAKAGVPDHPIVYYHSSDRPENQFYFWPGYRERRGENAIYVQQTKSPRPPPEFLMKEFSSVVDLGMFDVPYRGKVIRQIQLFACRGLL